jgi:flavodoxin
MKILIAYDSRTGNTEKMAELVAEGVRLAGQAVDVKKISEFKNAEALKGYDGYIFASPTYHRDMTNGMKTFLFMAQQAGLAGKVGGAFGSYTHSGDAPKVIFDTMQFVYKMNMTNLGSFNLVESHINTGEGQRACQDYGKAVGEQVGK